MAIAQKWPLVQIYTAGLVMGIVWLLMGATSAMAFVARVTPKTVVCGIQLSLALLLATQGVKMVGVGWESWALAVVAIAVALVLRDNRYAPAALVLVALGVAIMGAKGQLGALRRVSFALPPLTSVDLQQVWPALRDGGLAQIPLTATNAVIATAALISSYWPDRRVTERQLSFNMGVMNVIVPFFGGMPQCHGAGGLAGQYYFGARTGGTNVMEGLIEVAFGLFLGSSIVALFSAFPMPIVGAMMVVVGIELLKFAKGLRLNRELAPVLVTVIGSVAADMAVGFAAGVAVHYAIFRGPQGIAEPRPAERGYS